MRPTAIISSNANVDYLFLIPIVAASWELQGWNTDILLERVPDEYIELIEKYLPPGADVYDSAVASQVTSEQNPALFAQLWRLYWAGHARSEDNQQYNYILLSDADMFICNSFLNRDFDKVNVFGHDLTGYGQVPMCYVGAPEIEWNRIMQNSSMFEDLEKYADKDSEDWYKAWGADQDILTAKLKLYGYDKVNFIHRGTDPKNAGLPIGRVDRHNGMTIPDKPLQDAHLPRNPTSEENLVKITAIAKVCYPASNWDWILKYHQEFIEIK